MTTDDRRTEDGGGDEQAQSNVVRLPREWIGPIEDLVPFGPSAGSASSASPPYAAADLIPPGADDFWGEDSAAVQDALQAPTGHAMPEARHAHSDRTTHRRPSLHRPFPRALQRAQRNTPRLRRRGRATAAVGVVAGLALIVSVAESGPSANPKKDRSRAVATLPASIDAPSSKPSPAASTRRTANQTPVSRRRRSRRAEIHRASKPLRHTASQPGAPVQQAIVASLSGVSGSPVPAQGVPTSESSSPPRATASSHTQSAVHSSASPGPTGTASLIGPGTSPSG